MKKRKRKRRKKLFLRKKAFENTTIKGRLVVRARFVYAGPSSIGSTVSVGRSMVASDTGANGGGSSQGVVEVGILDTPEQPRTQDPPDGGVVHEPDTLQVVIEAVGFGM